jgi:hypothetical protein
VTTARAKPTTQRTLPASLAYARINLQSEAKLFSHEPDDDPGVLKVRATVSIPDFADDALPEDESARAADIEGIALSIAPVNGGDKELTILHADGVLLDLYQIEDAFETLDASSAELLEFACLLDSESREFHPDLEELLCMPTGSLAIIERVRVAPAWRGLGGLGRYLTARLIPWMFPDAAVVALKPFPIDVPRDDHGTADKTALGPALKQVERTWHSIGFERYKNGIWIMDPNATAHENAVADLEEKLRRLFPGFP